MHKRIRSVYDGRGVRYVGGQPILALATTSLARAEVPRRLRSPVAGAYIIRSSALPNECRDQTPGESATEPELKRAIDSKSIFAQRQGFADSPVSETTWQRVAGGALLKQDDQVRQIRCGK